MKGFRTLPRISGRHAAKTILFLACMSLSLFNVGCSGGSVGTPSGGGNTAPSISSLNPTAGPVGTTVTIAGANFGASQGSSTITFNGIAAAPTSWSATSIVAPVPTGATTGNVVVTVSGAASNGMPFTVPTSSAPVITGLSPNSGAAGTSVTIAGANFGASQGSSTIKFNGIAAIPTSWSATSIVAPVPAGATAGNVVVTVGGVPSNGMAFTVTTASAPSITSLNPTSGVLGTQVTIVGTNFGASQGSSTIKFNGTAAAPSSWSATSIVAPVPAGATTGNVVVTVGGSASNGVGFTVAAATAPSITSLAPTSGPVGTSVTITGANFGASQGSSTIQFNGTAAAPTGWSATSIVAPVPAGATTGNVVVTVGGTASNGVLFTVSTVAAKWPIKISANKRYFVDQIGTPWMMVGDSAHHIVNVVPILSWPTYFASRQALGFNTVNIFSCTHGNCPTTGATADGQLPFTGMITTPCNGTNRSDYDLATPNPLYWAELDSFVNMAASYGQVVLFDPLTTADYMNDMRASGSTKAFNFGAYLGSRYKNFPNIIWELGNDFQTWANTTPTCPGTVSDNTLVQQLMAGIASADTNHIQTIQLDYYRSYSNQDTTIVPYINADGVYTYYETYDYALKAYSSSPVSPVFLTEANMEGANNTNILSIGGVLTPANGLVLRRQMYWMMTSGAAGHVWGNTHVNHSDSMWQSQLNTPATLQVALLTTLFTKYQWWLLVPDQTHQVVTGGFGTANPNNENLYNANYATTAWIPNGSLSLTYVPSSPTTLTIAMSKFAGPTVTAQWYDPTNGTFTAVPGSFPNFGTQTFATPGNNSAGDPDWVLVLQ